MVIRKGEDILSELDDFAVKEFFKHHMVWRSWGNHIQLLELPNPYDVHRLNTHDALQPNLEDNPVSSYGFRTTKGIDPIKLRLFCLSLLWRAATSDLFEMSEIVLPKEELEFLRNLLVNRDPDPITFYPARVVQLSTRG